MVMNRPQPVHPAERAAILALSDERDQWLARVAAAERRGFEAGVTHAAGFGGFDQALREAYAAGQRSARRDKTGFDAGWAACLDRFADLIGGRIYPTRPTRTEIRRWTRHAPRCRHGGRGGSQSCQRARCIPGGREDFARPAPWDLSGPQMTERAARSWARLSTPQDGAA